MGVILTALALAGITWAANKFDKPKPKPKKRRKK